MLENSPVLNHLLKHDEVETDTNVLRPLVLGEVVIGKTDDGCTTGCPTT